MTQGFVLISSKLFVDPCKVSFMNGVSNECRDGEILFDKIEYRTMLIYGSFSLDGYE